MIEPGRAKIAPAEAGRVSAAGDLRRDATGFATRFGVCGLAACIGASTVTAGSCVAEPVAVCDTAVPHAPHNNAVERIATAEGAARLDDILTTVLPNPDINALPVRTPYHVGKAACSCPSPSTSLSPKRRSIAGGVRCISRISACDLFEIFHVEPAGLYIMLQIGCVACLAVGYSGVHG